MIQETENSQLKKEEIDRKESRIGKMKVFYTLHSVSNGNKEKYIIEVSDTDTVYLTVYDKTDARSLFCLLSDNSVDSSTFLDVATDYFAEKQI